MCESEYVFSYHISARTEAGSPDWRKNFLACSPTERDRKGKETKKKDGYLYEHHIEKLLSFIHLIDSCGKMGSVRSCNHLRHSPLMGRGCQTSDHVCSFPLE